MEILGLGVLIAYTTFAALQWREMRKETKAANDSLNTVREEFQRDQRPYVAISKYVVGDIKHLDDKEHKPIVGQPILVTVLYKNVGKSTALRLVAHRHIVFGKEVLNISVDPIDDDSDSSTALAQGQENSTSAVSVKDTFDRKVQTNANVDPSDLVPWDGSQPIIVFGRITYRDTDGNLYCTPFLSRYISINWTVIDYLSVPGTGIKILAKDLCLQGQR
jgi:hypothetical protein